MVQESCATARKLCDAAAVCFSLKFADYHYRCKSSQAPKARLQSSRLELYQVLKPQVQVQVQVLSLQVRVQVQVLRYKVQV